MKIVQIINTLRYRGGAEVFTVSLCEELNKRKDVDLTLVCLHQNIHPSFMKIILNSKIKLITINKKSKFDIKSISKLKEILKKINPDIVNSHLAIPLTYFLAFGRKRQNWKYFHTMHNIAKFESNKLGIFALRRLSKKQKVNFVGISEEISKSIVDLYGKCNLVTINNGIKFLTQNSQPTKQYDLICVAGFRPQKNHKLLFDAFEELYKKDNSLRLICLGNGELLSHYQNYINSLSCKNNIELPGAVDNVSEYLAKSKVFTLTSFYEGNPISILEALNLGLPVIAPNVGGIPNVIKSGRNGFLFEVDNKQELVACFDKLLKNDSLLKEIQLNNLKDSKMYSIEECCDHYLECYK